MATTGGIHLLSGTDGREYRFVDTSAMYTDLFNAAVSVGGPGMEAIVAFADVQYGGAFWVGLDTATIGLSSTFLPLTNRPPALRDLDRDGTVEIVGNVFTTRLDGSFLATWSDSIGNSDPPLIADLHGGGRFQVANHAGVWDALTGDGFLWPLHLWGPFTGPVFHKAPVLQAEEVLLGIQTTNAFLLTDTWGTPGWLLQTDSVETAHSVNWGGDVPTSAGDTDGDGEPEFCIPTWHSLALVSLDGEVEWSWEAEGEVPGGCTLADLDADGDFEVIEWGIGGLFIRDGATGQTLAEERGFVRTFYDPQAMVADIDADGSAEIIVSGEVPGADTRNDTVRAYGSATSSWARTRPVWHQRSYDITSITDDSMPVAWPLPSWEAYNAFRAQPAHDGDHPDLRPIAMDACADTCDGALPTSPVRVQVQVSNAGSQDVPAGTIVRLSTWDPTLPDPELFEAASVTLTSPVAAGWTTAGFLLEVPPDRWADHQLLEVRGPHPDECDPINDRIELTLHPCAP